MTSTSVAANLFNLQGGRCGIFGVNCPEWMMTMQVRTSPLLVFVLDGELACLSSKKF